MGSLGFWSLINRGLPYILGYFLNVLVLERFLSSLRIFVVVISVVVRPFPIVSLLLQDLLQAGFSFAGGRLFLTFGKLVLISYLLFTVHLF